MYNEEGDIINDGDQDNQEAIDENALGADDNQIEVGFEEDIEPQNNFFNPEKVKNLKDMF
jgi:hypothetical protein